MTKKREIKVKSIAVVFIALLSQFSFQAQAQEWNDVNVQSVEEQQRIREMRLLEWHAQEQAQQGYQTHSNAPQNHTQDVSYDQTIQQPSAPVTPEREDLFNAANAGNVQQISKLISQGINVNVTNNERETALHMAAARGHFDAVMVLVRNGANVNARTVKNWIPLHHAVRFKHANVVNFLIQRGASAYAPTSDGLTAVDMANNNRDQRLLAIMGAR